MSEDFYGNARAREQRVEALARRCRIDEADEEKALSVYQGMVEALADCIALRERRASADPPRVVFIAAYHHRYGVDLTAHATQDEAEAKLLSIAWQQCMRDPQIRAAVDARFGPLVAEQPPLEPPFEADEHESTGARADLYDAEVHLAEGDAWTADRETRRQTFREQLLEEWPQLARGEQLWVVRCEVDDVETQDDADHDRDARGLDARQ